MESQLTDAEIYIINSKQSIDNYIRRREFRSAFGLFVLVLARLEDDELPEFIQYYNNNLVRLGILPSNRG
jgi:DNA-binding protein Fis